MRLALVLLAVALSGCQISPPAPYQKGPSHSFNGKALASPDMAELSNRDLMNQRGRGTAEQPRAQFIVPPAVINNLRLNSY